ncbi:hypothetical protein CDEST_00191 [Colletotrichum destructivum]|uniref:Uncharacterized protein n=1 Tax=Colletotrichum destructivum TaxID=34406 RepID=A0AAX4HVK2_9PEZI|nr:hypothetical protein CDEST_00191 [Colletotrichum destructivum]
MADNHSRYGSAPSRQSSDQSRSHQEASERPQRPVITSLPSLRPSNSTPRRSPAPGGQAPDVYGFDDKYSLFRTYNSWQPTSSLVAAGPTYPQSPSVTSAGEPTMASCNSTQSSSPFASSIDHSRRKTHISNTSATHPWKPHQGVMSLPSTRHVLSPQSKTSGPRLGSIRTIPTSRDKAGNNADSQSQETGGSLFVDPFDPVCGSSLDRSDTSFLAHSSPLRVPSSPGDNHIGDLRVAAKLESRSYRTGFFPEAEPLIARDMVVSEDGVVENNPAGIQISGFILENDDTGPAPTTDKSAREAKASSKHAKSTKSKESRTMKLMASGDDMVATSNRLTQPSSVLVEHEQTATPHTAASYSHTSPNSSNFRTEEIPQAKKGKTHHTPYVTWCGTQEKAPATAEKPGGIRGFNLMSNMAIRASKPVVRVVAVPKHTSKPGSQDSRLGDGLKRGKPSTTNSRLEPSQQRLASTEPSHSSASEKNATRGTSGVTKEHETPPNAASRARAGVVFPVTSPSTSSRQSTPGSHTSTTQGQKPKVLNQRGVDPSTLGLVPINTLPGPLYEPEFRVAEFANAKYAAAIETDSSSRTWVNARIGLKMGRRRSQTLPEPNTGNAANRSLSAASAECRDHGFLDPTNTFSRLTDAHQGTGTHHSDIFQAKSLVKPNEESQASNDHYWPLSEDEASARNIRDAKSRYDTLPSGSPRKSRAQVQSGCNPLMSEKQTVEGLGYPGSWRENQKRTVTSFLSPKSIQEEEPEKKRVRNERSEPKTGTAKKQLADQHGQMAFS